MMQTIVDYSAAAVALGLVLVRFRAVVKTRGDRRAVKVLLFTLSVVLFVVFQIDGVYTAADRLAGVNNLSWLLSYVFMTAAAYYLCFISRDEMPRWARPFGIATVVALVLIFPFGPARAPETTDHVTPANLGEVAFMGAVYAYFVIMVSTIPIPACIRTLRAGQQALPDRIRTCVILPALAVTVSNALTKFVIYGTGFFFPAMSPALRDGITDLSRLQAGALVILWPMAFAPGHLYRVLARPVAFWQKIRACRDLGELEAWLDAVCPGMALGRVTLLDFVRSPDFYIYRRTIGILDRKKMLARVEREEAARLYRRLAEIPRSATFDELVATCQELSRQITGEGT